MLGVHPSKGLVQHIRQPTDVYCCCYCMSAAATSCSAEVENICTAESVRGWRAMYKKAKNIWGSHYHLHGSARGGKQSVVF